MTVDTGLRPDGTPDAAAPENASRGADETSAGRGRGARRALVVQPAVLAVAVAVFLLWRATAELTETESRQLGWDALSAAVVDHLELTMVAGAIVLVGAVPLGIGLTRRPLRRFAPAVLAVANTGQAAPAIGLFVLLATWLGFGFVTAVVTLVLYSALPVLRNTLVGVQGVDPRLVEAGRGMGMSALSVLLRIELPLAVPVLLAGVRTALVLLVGTATLATFIDGGGLGALINTGITLSLDSLLISGAVLVALLALAVDWLGRVVEHVARPKGI
jgi:osmoprotectant transport system permease protein